MLFHAEEVFIKNASFVVQPAGNAKVRKTKQKNVHAFVRGILSQEFDVSGLQKIRYNPYKYTTFVVADTEEPVYESGKVYLNSEGKCFGGL